jgi:hypothetical protein
MTATPRDPFPNTFGLTPRYMWDRREVAVAAPAPKAPSISLETLPGVDTVTPDLRRRILAAAEIAPRRLPRYDQITSLAKPLGALAGMFAAVAAHGVLAGN